MVEFVIYNVYLGTYTLAWLSKSFYTSILYIFVLYRTYQPSCGRIRIRIHKADAYNAVNSAVEVFS